MNMNIYKNRQDVKYFYNHITNTHGPCKTSVHPFEDLYIYSAFPTTESTLQFSVTIPHFVGHKAGTIQSKNLVGQS